MYIYICIYIYIYVHIYCIVMHVLIRVYMCMCVYIYIDKSHVYIYIYIHVYIHITLHVFGCLGHLGQGVASARGGGETVAVSGRHDHYNTPEGKTRARGLRADVTSARHATAFAIPDVCAND